MGIHWSKYFFTFNELYQNTNIPKDLPKADIHAYLQQKELVYPNKLFTIHKQVLTLVIDLHKTEEELRKDMNRTTRYQINKAGRDDLHLQHITEPTMNDIDEFTAFFNPFAREKNIEQCKVGKLTSFMNQGKLVITYAYHKSGRKMASHLYIINGKRAVMLYSCSGRFANSDIPNIEIGRANRYLHWHDILFFKDQKYDYYDFLGLSIDPDNIPQQNINKFKLGFGGSKRTEYHSYIPQTIRGKLLLLALKFKWRKQHEIIHGKQLPVNRYLASIDEG